MKIQPKHQSNQYRADTGFTLLELLVVITIILILAGITVGGLKYVTAKQNNEKCKADIKLLETGLEAYKMDYGVYPLEVGNGSQSLFDALYWDTDMDGSPIAADPTQKIYVSELDPSNVKAKWTMAQGSSHRIVDPWSSDYNYRRGLSQDGKTPNPDAKNPDFDIWSAGPDGVFTPTDSAQTDRDNINNWR
jgi:prepilin-type N-terminal cleavage/methylation domain-containing protein